MGIIGKIWNGIKGLFGKPKGNSPSTIPSPSLQDELIKHGIIQDPNKVNSASAVLAQPNVPQAQVQQPLQNLQQLTPSQSNLPALIPQQSRLPELQVNAQGANSTNGVASSNIQNNDTVDSLNTTNGTLLLNSPQYTAPKGAKSVRDIKRISTGKIVNVLYGHGFKGGKLYSYFDPDGTRRVGQNIVVDVTNKKTGKTYKTMATVKSTHGEYTAGATDTQEYLAKQGIGLKTLESGLTQKQLPGYYKGWKADAKAQYDLETEYKLLPGMVYKNSQGENEYSEAFKSIQKQIANMRYAGKTTTRMRVNGDYNQPKIS